MEKSEYWKVGVTVYSSHMRCEVFYATITHELKDIGMETK
jgi:hypothetical protein